MTEPNSENQIPNSEVPSDPNYWRSFEELQGSEKFEELKHNEFFNGMTDEFTPEENLSAVSRRKFLALLGASAALAGAGCSDYRDKGEIVPYNKQPEGLILGKANHYASSCSGCAQGCGILIKTREGRPIKVDGNDTHPVNKGKICSKGHASILNLYDPDRIKVPSINTNGFLADSSWGDVDKEVIAALKANGNKEIAIVTGEVISPSFVEVLKKFSTAYPSAKIYSIAQFSNETRKKAWQKCYPGVALPLIQWDKAKVIVSLEGDFLGKEGNRVETNRLYASNRDIENLENFSRLYTVEGNYSLTGLNADYRFRLRPDKQLEFTLALANHMVTKRGLALNPALAAAASSKDLKRFCEENKLAFEDISLMAADLVKNAGKSILYAGDILDEKTHIAVNMINDALGNAALYNTMAAQENLLALSGRADIESLVSNLNKGGVSVLIVVDVNPVYLLAQDYGFKDAMTKAGLAVCLTEQVNETAVLSKYVLPINHNLESWGDVKTRTGIYGLMQPVIAPLYDTRQKEAMLLHWSEGNASVLDSRNYLTFIKNYWAANIYPKSGSIASFEKYWMGSLHEGYNTLNEKLNLSFKLSADAGTDLQSVDSGYQGFTLMLSESYSLGDGKWAGNGWLQELPHPVSKVTWDNYAAISYQTAKDLGVKNGDVLEIKNGTHSLTIPALVQPGLADNFLSIELGYGRSNSGIIANGVGYNANMLLSKSFVKSPWLLGSVSVSKTGEFRKIVSTQDHHAFDDDLVADQHLKRKILHEATVADYKKDEHFLHHGGHELHSFYGDHEYKGVKWAMAIDLNKCTGCGECVVACNSENNIPIVGKDQVDRGREMQWLRIDRYYSGPPESATAKVQPMLCQHCDNAPCENVCPVVATTHSPDGLNQMVYNRCVGTRYCSNNCPYKVRRFNFYNFRDHFANGYQLSSSFELIANPEVTVRSRGVMEKCTFCVQRIADARTVATTEGRTIQGSDVQTACQQACGTEAIVFGDMNDKDSKVTKLRNHNLGYHVLEELNTKPNVTYLVKLRNTHTEEA